MARTYETVDADGHILEPLTLWDDYLDPAFRDRLKETAPYLPNIEEIVVEKYERIDDNTVEVVNLYPDHRSRYAVAEMFGQMQFAGAQTQPHI